MRTFSNLIFIFSLIFFHPALADGEGSSLVINGDSFSFFGRFTVVSPFLPFSTTVEAMNSGGQENEMYMMYREAGHETVTIFAQGFENEEALIQLINRSRLRNASFSLAFEKVEREFEENQVEFSKVDTLCELQLRGGIRPSSEYCRRI